MAGKRQHYVPRLLQRGFLADPGDEGERAWLHRLGETPKLVGIRDIGVEDWFYSRRSADGQPTLDDEITELEQDLQKDVASFRSATLGTVVSSAIAAPLVAHLATRTAHIRAMMAQLLSAFSDGAIARLGTPEGLRRMIGLDAPQPSGVLRKAIGDAMADLPLEQLGLPPAFVERLFLFMAREMAAPLLEAQGDLLTPFLRTLAREARDKIRDGHNRAMAFSREPTGWAIELARFDWRIEAASHVILPDCVALAREDAGELIPFLLSSGRAAEAVLLPLAADRILVGVKPGAKPIDLSGFNRAAAAACERFFIGAAPADRDLLDLIGTRPGQAIREVVEEVFAELEGSGAQRPAAQLMVATPASTAAFSYPVVCSGIGDEAVARDIARIVHVIVTELSRTLPLSDLDGITFAADYAEALRTLDRGDPNLPPAETEALAYGVAAARCVDVVRDGQPKDHIVFARWIGTGLLAEDVDQRLHCAAIVAKELARLGHSALYARDPVEAIPPDQVVRMLYRYANQTPSCFFSSRASAFVCPAQGEIYADLVQTALAHARAAILEARLAYRTSGDLDALLAVALPCVRAVLGHAADWLGHRDGLADGATFPGDDLPQRLRDEGLEAWLELFGRDLRGLYEAGEARLDPDRLFALGRYVERLLWLVQICPWPQGDEGVYFSVPYGDDLALLEPGTPDQS